jgi:transposase
MIVAGLHHLYDFKGYRIRKAVFSPAGSLIAIVPDKRFNLKCPECQSTRPRKHRNHPQTALDLPVSSIRLTQISYDAIQAFCFQCKQYRAIHPPGIDKNAQATRRLMACASRLARRLPLDHVTEFIPVSRATIYRWDTAILEMTLPEPDLDRVDYLLVDEKCIRKTGAGPQFVALVLNGGTGELLSMTEGRKRESLQAFADLLSESRARGIKAVRVDRSGAYHKVIREDLPEAEVVFDKFHIVQNYNAVIDEVRRTEVNEADKASKKFIKGQRFNLFRRAENRTREQTANLEQLLAANKPLYQTHLLGEQLQVFWTYTYSAWAQRYLADWCRWAKESCLQPVVRFAKGLWESRAGLVAYFRHRITNGLIESFNATVQRVMQRCCGIRNLDYLWLKLRQESLSQVQQR